MKRKFLIFVLIGFISLSALSSSAFSKNQGIQLGSRIDTVNDDVNQIQPRAFPAVVAAGTVAARAGRAAYSAWKAVPAGDKLMMSQAAKRMIGLGGKDNTPNTNSEYIFD
ncbi:hypothetical protein [Staphylococcus schweitzeri]|uniref:Uncharacterized protein n=1 Tax=Staphylococcus schweitzeri TaxID=1654388 RepID=A0A077ULI4_9STAP|nr:hypothetical protein [Staphylococcus schweitzeri]CDR29226.1 hypothetical protein ERS140147_02431 [Staphylococcus schweitzeri]